nr:AAA family ATPase [Pseudomonas sp. B11D7D]
MKISKVTINNFRSIGVAHFDFDDFNIFVGQNNAGKTNFFEAIEWFFNGTPKSISIKDLHPKGDTTKTISVKIEFSGALHGAENMRNEANKTKMLGVLKGVMR